MAISPRSPARQDDLGVLEAADLDRRARHRRPRAPRRRAVRRRQRRDRGRLRAAVGRPDAAAGERLEAGLEVLRERRGPGGDDLHGRPAIRRAGAEAQQHRRHRRDDREERRAQLVDERHRLVGGEARDDEQLGRQARGQEHREHEAADVHHRHGAEQALLAGDELRAALGELALAGDEVGVREHRALRGAGRPARVLEHRDVAGVDVRARRRAGRREHLGEVGDDRLGLQRDAVVHRHDDPRAAVGQDPGRRVLRVERVDADERRAGTPRAVGPDRDGRVVGQAHRDAVARPDAPLDEPRGDAVGLRVELGERRALAAVPDRRPVAEARDGVVEHRGDGRHARLPRKNGTPSRSTSSTSASTAISSCGVSTMFVMSVGPSVSVT